MTKQNQMTGAQSLVQSFVASGVELCLANPGTSEMHFVAALDSAPDMRAVLGLFEGVVSGAADGYGRMAEKPAVGLFHLGPGFGNAIANLHNARRAASPIVAVIGDHATYHQQYDAPLASDILGLARPVCGWVKSCTQAGEVALAGAQAVQAARSAPGQTAALILPADTAWAPALGAAAPLPVPRPPVPDAARIDAVARLLRQGKQGKAAILLRGKALQKTGLTWAGRIQAQTGCRLLIDTFAPRLARGAGHTIVERIPYFAEQIVEHLKGLQSLIMVGAVPPVAFFAYPDKPSWPVPAGCTLATLAHPAEDGVTALRMLADALGANKAKPNQARYTLPNMSTTPFNAGACAMALVRHLPEGAIISDEAATSGLALGQALESARPHDHLALTGGAIGQGLPVATGAALACPQRKVVCLHGDGGAMYTLQSLWTQAREKLDVTNIIFSNRSYAILSIEMSRVGSAGGAKAASLFDLANPELNWVQLANGMGVDAARADTAQQFEALFADAMAQRGPRLIEIVL